MPGNVTNNHLRAAVACAVVLLGAGLAGCQRDTSTATLLAEAKQYQQKGDKKAALIQLKNAVAKNPEDGEARIALGALHLELGDAVSADKELRKAAALGIPAARTLPPLADAMLAQGQFQKLLDEVTPDKAQGSAQLLTSRADALLALRKDDEAKQAYEQALAAKPAAAEPRIGLARLAMLNKDSAAAYRYIDEAAAGEPNNAEVWMFKGGLLRMEGKPAEALAAYERALAVKPDHRSAHIDKANVEIGMGKFEAAKADIEAARKANPGNLLVTYTQALLDFTQGKYAAAQESLQKVLKNAPEHLPTILLAGAVELNLGSTQQAEQHLRKYLEAVPKDPYARKLLAQTMLKSAQPGDAVAALAPLLKEPTQDAQLLALAGQSYLQTKDFDKASTYFEKASALAPQAAVLHTSLGLSRLGQGEREKGISELELAAKLDPKSQNAGMALVQAELNMKRYDRALTAVQALEKQQPDNAQVQNLKGLVNVARQDRPAARAAFEKALALQPGYFAAVSNLARMDLQDKQPEAAKKRFETVLATDKKNIGAMSALAEIAMVTRKPDEATSWLEKASSENPDAVPPALRLGAHYLAINQAQKALTLARKFQAANPTNADLLDLLGQAQLANKDGAGALETYSKLVNVLPKSAPAQYRLATAHMALKNEAQAAEDLKRALALQPDYAPAVLAGAGLAVRAGRTDDAFALARQAQKQPALARVGLLMEADLLQQQQPPQPARALPLYEKAFALEKTPKLFQTIHRLQAQSGKEAEADARLAQWLKDNPDDIATSMYAAERSLMKKQYKPAIAQFEAILKKSPNNPVVLNNLAWAYQQVHDPKALETAEAAHKAGGDNPAVLDTLGAILTERGDARRAVELLTKAVAGAPDNPDMRLHLAQAQIKAGDKANARKELEKLAAKGGASPRSDEAKELLRQL